MVYYQQISFYILNDLSTLKCFAIVLFVLVNTSTRLFSYLFEGDQCRFKKLLLLFPLFCIVRIKFCLQFS